MARVCAGEREAFETLVETYWPVAHRVAYGILRDEQLAQDVAQDCFADLYMQRERYDPRFSFRAYVAAIARHKSLDLLRRQGKQRLTALDEQHSEGVGSPESAFIEELYRHMLFAVVEHLPERSQRMLKAYALEQRSYQQIAAELGISVAQVKITLHRIRKKLRRAKEDWEQ